MARRNSKGRFASSGRKSTGKRSTSRRSKSRGKSKLSLRRFLSFK